MFISQQLRKENIAEYVLYMWQVEDIIRAYGCNLSLLRKEYISRFDYTEEQREEMTGEIETCLNALYGTMLLRLQHKDITPNTANAVKEITTFLGMLSDYYKKDKEEGINFDEE